MNATLEQPRKVDYTRVWTIQSTRVVDILLEKGVYKPKPKDIKKHSEYHDTSYEAYSWITKRVNEKLNVRGVLSERKGSLIWFDESNKKSKKWLRAMPVEKQLVCRIPDEYIVAIDARLWHIAVFGEPILQRRWTGNQWHVENAPETEINYRANPSPEKLQENWECIFDTSNATRGIEYLTTELRKEWILEIR